MTLPRFFDRAAQAAAAAGVAEDDLRGRLADVTVELGTRAATDDPNVEGYLLAANLVARLYPRLRLDAPADLQAAATDVVLAINPAAHLAAGAGTTTGDGEVYRLWIGAGGPPASASAVNVDAAGWTASIDCAAPSTAGPASAPAALAAAALGVGEIFRSVFGTWLPRAGRDRPTPAVWDLVTGACWDSPTPDSVSWTSAAHPTVDIGTLYLAGAGAVGQAAALTLRVAGASGHLVVVDPETVDTGNLQRYVLTDDGSEGKPKAELLVLSLAGTQLAGEPVPSAWGATPETTGRKAAVAVALDTADARIGVAAGVHDRVYNAWTGPVDLGWSRHEEFGGDLPCLACLYWPRGRRPSTHERIGAALNQHPLRISSYLLPTVALESTLNEIPQLIGQEPPPEAGTWLTRSLLEDLVAQGTIAEAATGAWAGRHLLDLWHEGVCGATLLGPDTRPASEIPLAHQSALAGVMLAAQVLIAADPVLRSRRDTNTEGRVDVLSGMPQTVGRPRRPVPTCICRDADFRSVAAAEVEAVSGFGGRRGGAGNGVLVGRRQPRQDRPFRGPF